MTLLGGIVHAIGIAVLLWGVAGPLLKGWQASSWDERAATVVHVSLESSRTSKNGTTWAVSARYRYHAGGQDYIGTRVGLHGGSDNIGTWHRRTADRLQAAQSAGRTITVVVNPDDSTRSVIDPHPRLQRLLLTLVFSAAGATAMWFASAGDCSR